jgi:hypothetical protein
MGIPDQIIGVESGGNPNATNPDSSAGDLRDAATYITKLPKKEADTAEWQAAIEALMLVATSGSGPTTLARIGIMRGIEPPRRTGLQSVAQGKALGPAQAGPRPLAIFWPAF